MKRPNHILTRDDLGRQVVVLEIETEVRPGEPAIRYELPNRSEVARISDAEFVVVHTGRVLIKQMARRAKG